MNDQLFRKEALVRIESPERLNEMVKITSARSWLILTALIGIVVAFVLWSLFGELPYTITGHGILQQPGGIIEVSAIGRGRIKRTVVSEGDYIKVDEIIAYIDQPELEMQISNAKKELQDFNNRFQRISEFGYENIDLKRKLYEKEAGNINNAIQSNNERLKFITERISAQEELLAKGLITKETLNNTKNEYFKIQQENDKLLNEKKEIDQKIYEIKEQNEIKINQLKSEILNLENKLRELEAVHELNSKIISPYSGKIIELMVNPGKVIETGSPIVSIEPTDLSKDLQAIVYVNPKEGKKIEHKMNVKLSPSTVEVEEYGYITGTVENVSEYPSTYQGMLRTLGNLELVKTFTKDGPPIAVIVRLDKDSTNYSGYTWTSKYGPKVEIKSGTLCLAKIVTEKRRPISLLFPKMTIKVKNLYDEFEVDSAHTNKKDSLYKMSEKESVNTSQKQTEEILKTKVGYTIQIGATKRKLNQEDLKYLYKGEEKIKEGYIDGWYKYSIGFFDSKEEANLYIKKNHLGSNVYIRKVNK